VPPDGGRLTRHVSEAIPSDAGSARWKVEAVGGLSSSASRKGRVGWLDSDAQAGLFGQLQYPTPPLRARKNLDRHPNYILAAYMSSGT
jgi:hypothetical protein